LNPRELKISDFSYELPEHRIARYPLPDRDRSKLLVSRKGSISDHFFYELPSLLPEDSFLIFNNSKVLPARIRFRTEKGKDIEVFCLEPATGIDHGTAMAMQGKSAWICLIGGNRKWKSGRAVLQIDKEGPSELELQIRRKEMTDEGFLLDFEWTPAHLSFADVLERAGSVPLPPYLGREAEESDKIRYQTIYARAEGSVAAPTAGLHFSGPLMKRLKDRGTALAGITLHVGAGTFKPVISEDLSGHPMHHEWMEIPLEVLKKLRNHRGKPVIAVGTTSMRSLESIYWIGVKIIKKGGRLSMEDLGPGQWDPYDIDARGIGREEALQAVVEFLEGKNQKFLRCKTQILIAPPYRVAMINGLITNFHQPGSTLLLLVAALPDSAWRAVYVHALNNNYRFLSYGDSSLFLF